MTLSEAQRLHVKCFAKLLNWGLKNGYEFTWGEALRTQAQALANAQNGSGIAKSLHLLKLAIDINLFKDGVYQPTTEAHAPLGAYWKTLDPLCCWGGDFVTRPDGNHYSITWNGIK